MTSCRTETSHGPVAAMAGSSSTDLLCLHVEPGLAAQWAAFVSFFEQENCALRPFDASSLSSSMGFAPDGPADGSAAGAAAAASGAWAAGAAGAAAGAVGAVAAGVAAPAADARLLPA